MSRSYRSRLRPLAAAAIGIALLGGAIPAASALGGETGCEVRNLTNPNGVSSDLTVAIAAASGGETIEVRGTCTGGTWSPIASPGILTVVGKRTTALGRPTITAAAANQPVIVVNGSPAVTIRGLRITGASGSIARGGGIRLDSGTLRLDSVRIDGITATVIDGGGIFAVFGTTIVLSKTTRITGTSAETGGGIYAQTGVTITMRDRATIDHTSADWGGAIIMAPTSVLTMRDRSSIHHASATGGGGAIGGDDGVAITLRDDASLHHNTAGGYGTAINSGGTIVLRDRASVHDNAIDGPGIPDAGGFGSAIDLWRYGTDPTTLTIRDAATVRANTALAGGAGILLWTACGLGNDPVVTGAKRTRVFGNSPKNVVRYDSTAGC